MMTSISMYVLSKELNLELNTYMVHLQLQRYTEEKLTESKIHVILSTSFADDASLVLDQIKV